MKAPFSVDHSIFIFPGNRKSLGSLASITNHLEKFSFQLPSFSFDTKEFKSSLRTNASESVSEI